MNPSADEGLDSVLAASPLLAIALAQAADVSRQAPEVTLLKSRCNDAFA